VTRCFDLVEHFEGKLNYEKTEGIYIGRQAGRNHGPVPIKWHTDHITILGANIGNRMEQEWNKHTEKIENTLERWSHRHLTIKGRATLLRTFAVAHVTYLAALFPIPATVVQKLTRVMFSFLWETKNERISRETCFLSPNQGGLGIPDLGTASKAMLTKWVTAITNQTYTATWVNMARYWTGTALSTLNSDWEWLRSNLKPHADPTTVPSWYKTLVTTLQQHRLQLTSSDTKVTSKQVRIWLTPEIEPRAVRKWRNTT
jgi:hypothetical protein